MQLYVSAYILQLIIDPLVHLLQPTCFTNFTGSCKVFATQLKTLDKLLMNLFNIPHTFSCCNRLLKLLMLTSCTISLINPVHSSLKTCALMSRACLLGCPVSLVGPLFVRSFAVCALSTRQLDAIKAGNNVGPKTVTVQAVEIAVEDVSLPKCLCCWP